MGDITGVHRFVLRVPPGLWDELGVLARERGVSVNALVVDALERRLAFERDQQGVSVRGVPDRVSEVSEVPVVSVAGRREQVDALLARSGGKVFRGPDFRKK